MRQALYILLLSLLAGCASYSSYYYPVQIPGEGVYLADRPVYGAQPVYGSGASYGRTTLYYADAVHYPWWSMDYFYLGGPAYQPVNIWVSPWYPYYRDPHYYHSPYFWPHRFSLWYAPWHHRYRGGGYYAWCDPYWYGRYRHHYRPYHNVDPGPYPDNGYSAGGNGGRYGLGGSGYDQRGVIDDRTREREMMDRGLLTQRSASEPGAYRRRATTATGTSGETGMVVRSRNDAKVTPSRTQPVSAPVVSYSASPVSDDSRPVLSGSRLSNVRIISRSDSRETRSVTGPVSSPPAVVDLSRERAPQAVVAPVRLPAPVSAPGQAAPTVRYRSDAKPSISRTMPTAPQPARPVVHSPQPVTAPARRMTAPAITRSMPSAPSRSYAPRYDRGSSSMGSRSVSGPSRSRHDRQ